MVIEVYDKMLEGLKRYNDSVEENFGNKIVPILTKDSKLPLTIFSEVRNTANARFRVGDKVANVSYSVDVFAQNMGKFENQFIARTLVKIADDYLTNLGLLRNSYNVFYENGGSVCHIAVTYSGNLFENRGILI
jgi:hypothetical protein